MAAWNPPHQDPLRQCPVVPGHKVAERRLMRHIHDCVKQHPEFQLCDFNSMHAVRATEMETHLLSCPEKIMNDRQHARRAPLSKVAVKESMDPLPGDDDEFDDWGDTNSPNAVRAPTAMSITYLREPKVEVELLVDEWDPANPLPVNTYAYQKLKPAQREKFHRLIRQKSDKYVAELQRSDPIPGLDSPTLQPTSDSRQYANHDHADHVSPERFPLAAGRSGRGIISMTSPDFETKPLIQPLTSSSQTSVPLVRLGMGRGRQPSYPADDPHNPPGLDPINQENVTP